MFGNLLLEINCTFLLTATCGLLLYKTLVLQVNPKIGYFGKYLKIPEIMLKLWQHVALLMKVIYKNVTGNMLLMLVAYF